MPSIQITVFSEHINRDIMFDDAIRHGVDMTTLIHFDDYDTGRPCEDIVLSHTDVSVLHEFICKHDPQMIEIFWALVEE